MNKTPVILLLLIAVAVTFQQSCKDKEETPEGSIQLTGINLGSIKLDLQGANPGMPVDRPLELFFSGPLDTLTAEGNVVLTGNQETVASALSYSQDLETIVLTPLEDLEHSTKYTLGISGGLKGISGESFPGWTVEFETEEGKLQVAGVTLNGRDFSGPPSPRDISRESVKIEIGFSLPLDPDNYKSYFSVSGQPSPDISISGDNLTVTVTTKEVLDGYSRYYFNVSSALKAANGFSFDGFYNSFYTVLDSTYKFPLISDEELLDLVQSQTFRYFYDFAHPVSGLARERNTSGDVVTTGGSGFGVMALIVGIERGFITRQQGLEHLQKVLGFLETCDRFHGAWPHWLDGSTGKTRPFSEKDDGADLVETSFMVQGLITLRQYLNPEVPPEQEMIDRINLLAGAVEWDWFTRGQNVLYWHWSPNYGWQMNMQIVGYNETLITYVLAASSEDYGIGAEAYHQGYARNGAIINGNSYHGYTLPLGGAYGGPLFFTHYSHLGLDPRNLRDSYASYWEQGVNMSLINRAHCVENPGDFVGYGEDSWGLTASDNPWGYNAHSPVNDLGVITPTAAVSALPYTPEQSMDAIRHFYYLLGDRLWGEYGFYDAFNVTEGWWAGSYLAIDQGPIICMIENYRTGLLWDLFMSAPEVQQGLDKLGFSY